MEFLAVRFQWVLDFSSSAALECGIGYAMSKMFDLKLTKEAIAAYRTKNRSTLLSELIAVLWISLRLVF